MLMPDETAMRAVVLHPAPGEGGCVGRTAPPKASEAAV
jgi:hypothetical protein